MARKAPRRTAERIVETALGLFNRFGAPNVSTTLIAGALGISPGNLHYHFPAKGGLIETLFEHYRQGLDELLAAAGDARDLEDAWFFLHTLFERIWQYRFLYRDLNDLLSNYRRLEIEFQQLLTRKQNAVLALLDALRRTGGLRMEPADAADTARCMVVLLTYWLSYEHALQPRQDDPQAQAALLRGAYHVLNLLAPWLAPAERRHLTHLAEGYQTAQSLQ